jgi:hypothetical protein
LPLFLYLFFFTLSIFAAADIRLFSFEFCLVLQALLLYIYLINWIRTPRDVMFVITLVLIGMILESVIMIAVRIGGPTILPAIFKARLDDPTATGSVPRVARTCAQSLDHEAWSVLGTAGRPSVLSR